MDKVIFGYDDDVLDPCMDPVTKAIFTKDTPESRAALNGLLSDILGQEVGVFAVGVNEPPVDDIRDRQIRYDINCRFSTGELANVEMTMYPDASEVNRLEYYAAKLHASQNLKGKDKSYKDVKKTYQISFVVKERLLPDEVLVHWFEYYDKKNKISLGGCSNVISIELCKLDSILKKPLDEMTGTELWAMFFRFSSHMEHRPLINEIVQRKESIAMAAKTLITISKDEIERARLLSEYKYLMDLQSKMVDARRAGRAEGKEEGKLEMIKSLHSMGLSDEQIAQAANMPLDKVRMHLKT